jgi:ribulose-5-phosphate 4-epimerase/fuculose-1-phosphate aldolase
MLSDTLLPATLPSVKMPATENALTRAKSAIATSARRLSREDLLPRLQHDLAIRLGDDSFLLSPGQGDPRELDVAAVVEIPQLDSPDVPNRWNLHRTAFEAREDVSVVAIVSSMEMAALSSAGRTLAQCMLTRPIVDLGEPEPSADGESLVERAVGDALAQADLVSLGRYGVVAVASNFNSAVDNLVALSRVAKTTRELALLGGTLAPSERQMELSKSAATELGLGSFGYGCASCNACPRGHLHKAGGGVTSVAAVEFAVESTGETTDELADAVSRHLRR